MAELPDLTVFAQILTRRFQGKTLEKLVVTEARKLNVTAKELRSALEGAEMSGVSRESKTLQLHFSGGKVLGLHLMLRDELVALEGEETPRFHILGFHFKDGMALRSLTCKKRLHRPHPVLLCFFQAYCINLVPVQLIRVVSKQRDRLY